MSGHSKWSSIKHQKGAADAKRGKVFTKLGHAITVAVRENGGQTDTNPRLVLAMEMARKNNMPKENIERAIKRGTGEGGGTLTEELTYEAYGPGGTAIYMQTITDNRNRTISAIRAVLGKHGGNLGESGSVAYLFKPQAVLTVLKGDKSSDAAEMTILESEANDYEVTEDGFMVYCTPAALSMTQAILEAAGLTVNLIEQKYVPTQTVLIEDEKVAGQIMQLIEALEGLDDVADVISNFA